MEVFHIQISNEYDIDHSVTYLSFQAASSWSNCTVDAITPQELHAFHCNCTMNFLHKNHRKKFNVYHCLTFLNFQTSWRWQAATPCKYNNSQQIAWILMQIYIDVLHIKISEDFDIEIYVTFLNFNSNSRSRLPCECDKFSGIACTIL